MLIRYSTRRSRRLKPGAGGQDPRTRRAVAVRVNGVGHGGIGLFVGQERGDVFDNRLRVGADQFDRTHFDRLWAFGGVAHHQDRLAETGGFFLDTAGVGQY